MTERDRVLSNRRAKYAMARSRQTDPRSQEAARPDPSPARRRLLPRALPLIFLVAVTSACYLNADHEEFLFDWGAGGLDVRLREQTLGEALESFWQAPHKPGEQLSHVSFALNCALNEAVGLDRFEVTSFLIVNVMIHALNACLVYFLVRSMLSLVQPDPPVTSWLPLAAATLFAVHPMHASSVAYVLQRRGVLATCFYLLGVLSYLRARRWLPRGPDVAPEGHQAPQGVRSNSVWPWPRLAWAAAVPVCYWLSFKSKPLGLTLPFAILAIEFCLRARHRQGLKRYLLAMAAGLLLCTSGMFVYLWSEGLFDPARLRILPYGPEGLWGPWAHFLTESRAFVHYWSLLLLPLPQWSCIDHSFPLSRTLFEHYAVVAVAFHSILLALAVVAAFKRYTLAAVGVFWFYIALIPYLLLPQTELLVEYKTYLPCVGVVLILAEGFRVIRRRVPMALQAPVVVALAAALMFTTVRRNVIYRSAINLWSDAVEKCPDYYRPHNNLANALVKQGRFVEAVAHYNEAIRLAPSAHLAHRNLGLALARQKRFQQAIPHYRRSLELKNDDAETHRDLADALAQLGRADEAISHYKRTLALRPDHAEAHHNLANVLLGKRNIADAVRHYRMALKGRGDDPDVRLNLARALVLHGKPGEAIPHYRELVRLRPESIDARNELANALFQQGQAQEAIAQLEAALRLRPDYATGHFNLATILLKQERMTEAIEHYRRVLQLNPEHVRARVHLGFALFKAGKIDEAIRAYREALRRDPHDRAARDGLDGALAEQPDLPTSAPRRERSAPWSASRGADP